ncbi:hypothetical protein [Bacteroides sp. AM54-2NS]|uniref:hypothetical protein n=1 Tax=Bacteroides sp. AM54-2NS TaxID=2292955 RepID=UPI0010084368|nr:hypothetical protein [Bacteroides sp. AM54-2NS]
MKKLIPVIYLLCIHWISCAQEIPQKVPIPESELMSFPSKKSLPIIIMVISISEPPIMEN